MYGNYNNFMQQPYRQQPNYVGATDFASVFNNYDMMQKQQGNQNVNWTPVNGIEGAKNHIVMRNETAWLMDNNEQRFYVKSVDNSGVATLKIYEFREISDKTQSKEVSDTVGINLQDFVKRTEIEEIIEQKLEELAKQSLKGGNRNDRPKQS